MASDKELEKMFAELRSKTLRKTNNSEKEIRATYKAIMKDLNSFVSEEYSRLSQDGKLSYSVLQQKGEYARFLEEVTQRLDGLTPEIKSEITKLVNETYELNYKGMVDVVSKSKDVASDLENVKASLPETIKQNVNNPIDKLTLNDTLEYNRVGITYNIRKQIGIGLVNGDRYEEMSKRISESLDGDYKKSIRIVRTEAHKVREKGLNDAAQECSDAINNGTSGMVMVKIWRTGKDSRVRDTHAAMEGVTVLTDEMFELPSGATTLTPGDSGVPSEDINCRCYCSYKLMTKEEYEKATGKKYNKNIGEVSPEIDQEKLKRDLEMYVGGGYGSVKQAVTPEEFEYIKSNMKETEKKLYRIEESFFTAQNLKTGTEFEFEDDIRSFSREKSYAKKLLEYDDGIFDEPVIFETTGKVKHFNMDDYAEAYYEYQAESLVGGKFKVIDVTNEMIRGKKVKKYIIKML